MGVDNGAGGFFAEDLGLWGGVEACAEVSAVVGRSVYWGEWGLNGDAERGGGFTCRCS